MPANRQPERIREQVAHDRERLKDIKARIELEAASGCLAAADSFRQQYDAIAERVERDLAEAQKLTARATTERVTADAADND